MAPNIALMRIAAHHRALGHEVELRRGSPEPQLWDEEPDFVYGSAIFQSTRPVAERLRLNYPQAIIGGTGCDLPPLVVSSLESVGITDAPAGLFPLPEFPPINRFLSTWLSSSV